MDTPAAKKTSSTGVNTADLTLAEEQLSVGAGRVVDPITGQPLSLDAAITSLLSLGNDGDHDGTSAAEGGPLVAAAAAASSVVRGCCGGGAERGPPSGRASLEFPPFPPLRSPFLPLGESARWSVLDVGPLVRVCGGCEASFLYNSLLLSTFMKRICAYF